MLYTRNYLKYTGNAVLGHMDKRTNREHAIPSLIQVQLAYVAALIIPTLILGEAHVHVIVLKPRNKYVQRNINVYNSMYSFRNGDESERVYPSENLPVV